MRIGLDISQIVHRGTGVSRYLEGLTLAILEHDTENDWVFFFSSLRQKLNASLALKIVQRGFELRKYQIPPSLLSLLWNRWHVFPVNWFTGHLDWFISSDWTEPPVSRGIKKATIIHDLVFLRYPETVDWKILNTQQQRLIHVCNESQLIFADSKATAADIKHFLTLKKAKLKIIYPGVDIQKPDKQTVAKVLQKFRLTNQRFVLTVGKLEPRKNLERLIKSYQNLNSANKYPLIIVGPKGWGSLDLASRNVRVLGLVEDQELQALYASCLFFVYPSLYEGFGYPLVEAMALGAPTAASATSSLIEIGKNVSQFFDPENPTNIAQQMQRLFTDKKLRQDLAVKGQLKAKEFSWSRAYQAMISSLSNL